MLELEHEQHRNLRGAKAVEAKKDEASIAGSARSDQFKALASPGASPTTPFQFEAARQQQRQYLRQQQQQQQQQQHMRCYDNSSMFDDAARIHSSIQLQLLSYIRSVQGAGQRKQHRQQGAEEQFHQQQQRQEQEQLHRFHQWQQQQQQHPTIALLQQRFQRLERDKETRQAKQLYNSGQVLDKFPSSSTFSSSSSSPSSSSSSCSSLSSTSCSLQLSASRSTPLAAGFHQSSIHPTVAPFACGHRVESRSHHADHISLSIAAAGEPGQPLEEKSLLLSLLLVRDQSMSIGGLGCSSWSSSSTLPVEQPYATDGFLHKDWKGSIAVDDDEEEDVDTTLHL